MHSLRLYKRLHCHQKDRKRPHLIAKYGMKCFWCGCTLQRQTMTIDHYIPLSKGGSNKIKNLRIACNICNQKRGNAMPEETPKVIADASIVRIPNSWTPPKYHFGQRVKQGEIIGLEYHPPGTRRAYELGQGWTYTVLADEYSGEVEIYKERQIELLTSSELNSEIQELIDLYTSRISALTEQLEGK